MRGNWSIVGDAFNKFFPAFLSIPVIVNRERIIDSIDGVPIEKFSFGFYTKTTSSSGLAFHPYGQVRADLEINDDRDVVFIQYFNGFKFSTSRDLGWPIIKK